MGKILVGVLFVWVMIVILVSVLIGHAVNEVQERGLKEIAGEVWCGESGCEEENN